MSNILRIVRDGSGEISGLEGDRIKKGIKKDKREVKASVKGRARRGFISCVLYWTVGSVVIFTAMLLAGIFSAVSGFFGAYADMWRELVG